jgi:hypothetical protein
VNKQEFSALSWKSNQGQLSMFIVRLGCNSVYVFLQRKKTFQIFTVAMAIPT